MPTLADIARLLDAPLDCATVRADLELRNLATLADAGPDELSFVDSEEYLRELAATRAAAVVVKRGVRLPPQVRPAVILVDDFVLAMSRLLEHFAPRVQQVAPGIDAAARVDPSASIGDGVRIGPFAFVGARARIGNRCILHAGVFLGDDATIGDDCVLWPAVVIRERCTLGSRVIVHSGAVIGSDGFGYRWDGQRHAKIPQIGTVIIEDDVEIGSCTCIDRAKIGITRVGRGSKIDNLVQIAHNCIIGPHSILAGQAGLAGSVKLGEAVVLGGQTAVSDHLNIGAGTMAAGRSGIATDIEPGSRVSGLPALPHRQTLREQAALRRLPELINQVRLLKDELESLKRRLPQPPSG